MSLSSISINTRNKRQLLLLSDIGLIMVAVLWGSSYSVAKISLAFYPVLGFLAVRFGLTTLLLLPVLWRTFREDVTDLKRSFTVGLPLGLLLWLVFIFETFAVLYTSVANVAFLISLCLIITPFLEWLWLKKRPAGLVFVCALLSLLGTFLLVMPSGDFHFQLVDALVLIASFCRASVMVLTKKKLQNQPVSALNLTAVQSMVVFVGSLGLFMVTQWWFDKPLTLPTHSTFWLATAYLVVCCTLFAFFIQNWAIDIGSPSRASLLMGSEPLFGALFAVLLFGENIGVMGWFGGGLIMLASIMLVLKKD